MNSWLWTAAAAVFLIEAWLWDMLGAATGAIVAALPIEPLRLLLRRLIGRLPAAFAFALFVIPVLAILPFKILGLVLFAHGRLVAGAAVFLVAKAVGVGVAAFLFDVCHERLMGLRWFATLYDHVIAIRRWAQAMMDPYRRVLRSKVSQLRARVSGFLAANGSRSVVARVVALRARAYDRFRR